jgi:maltose O-acetyltransferase
MRQQIKTFIKRALFLDEPDLLSVLRKKGLKVGKNFTMREGCIIDFSHTWHIEIGDDVILAPRVHILAHDASTWNHLGYTKVRNVKIGSRVFIGAGSIILPGVTIGDDVIIGAGSVVSKNIPEKSVFTGNPAVFVMSVDAYIEKARMKMNAENCFGTDFSESENVSEEKKELVKAAADKFGTAFLK